MLTTSAQIKLTGAFRTRQEKPGSAKAFFEAPSPVISPEAGTFVIAIMHATNEGAASCKY
jgi:hypothetical protein